MKAEPSNFTIVFCKKKNNEIIGRIYILKHTMNEERGRYMTKVDLFWLLSFLMSDHLPWSAGQKCRSGFWCGLVWPSDSHSVAFSPGRPGPVNHRHTKQSNDLVWLQTQLPKSVFWISPLALPPPAVVMPGSICNVAPLTENFQS